MCTRWALGENWVRIDISFLLGMGRNGYAWMWCVSLTLDFKVKFSNNYISGTVSPIGIDQKVLQECVGPDLFETFYRFIANYSQICKWWHGKEWNNTCTVSLSAVYPCLYPDRTQDTAMFFVFAVLGFLCAIPCYRHVIYLVWAYQCYFQLIIPMQVCLVRKNRLVIHAVRQHAPHDSLSNILHSQHLVIFHVGVLQYLTSQDAFVPGPSLRISDSTRC